MAQVRLSIAGRDYDLACRDGEEDHLRRLGAMVDARAAEAGRAVGTGNEPRQLVMAALLLADELIEAEAGETRALPAEAIAAVEKLAERIEALADRLENVRATS